MMHKLKLILTTLAIVFSGLLVATPALVSADVLNTEACSGLTALGGTSNCTNSGQSQLQRIIGIVVSLLSWVLGIAGIIMVVLSAFKYITSGGDSGKVASAKNTLIYAAIGLVVAALAQFLVHFVFNTTNRAITPCSTSQPSIPKTDPTCKTPGA